MTQFARQKDEPEYDHGQTETLILTSERSQIVYELCVVLENRVPS